MIESNSLVERLEMVMEEFALHKDLQCWLNKTGKTPYVILQALVTTLATMAVRNCVDGSPETHAAVRDALVAKLRMLMDSLHARASADRGPGSRERKLAVDLAASLGVEIPIEKERGEPEAVDSLSTLVEAARILMKARRDD